MEIINTPISSALISSFSFRKRWDLDKHQDIARKIAREDSTVVLPSLIEEYDQVEGSLTVWSIIYGKLSLKVSAGKGHTEYARLSVYAYAANFILESNNSNHTYHYMQGANYALLESYSLLRLVP